MFWKLKDEYLFEKLKWLLYDCYICELYKSCSGMADKILFNLPILTKENCRRWKFQMRAALKSIKIRNHRWIQLSAVYPVFLNDNSNVNAVNAWKKCDFKTCLIIEFGYWSSCCNMFSLKTDVEYDCKIYVNRIQKLTNT